MARRLPHPPLPALVVAGGGLGRCGAGEALGDGAFLGHYHVADERPPEVVGAEGLQAGLAPQAREDVVDGLVAYAPPGGSAVLENQSEERTRLLAAIADPAFFASSAPPVA